MKFVLHRNTENRNQKIPFPAMQVAGLADAEQLTIQADAGSILISREDITARQAITTITHLYEVIDSLILQLWMPAMKSSMSWISPTLSRPWMRICWMIFWSAEPTRTVCVYFWRWRMKQMRNDTYLYTDGLDAARRSGQIALWRASHQANIACKKAIEDSIRQGFDGVHLKEDCAKEVLEEFGFKRVNWVLANTIQEKSGDGRFRPDNRSWAQRTFIPEDMGHKVEFIVNSHSEVVNGFVNQVRDAYQKLNLFGPEHCEPNSWEDLDYAGKVLVLSPDTLRESCWTQENQLWYAHDGFGCSPHAIGRSIRCTCLGDGEHTRWNRSDFIGVLQENLLPEWAEEKLNELTGQNVDHSMEGMKME